MCIVTFKELKINDKISDPIQNGSALLHLLKTLNKNEQLLKLFIQEKKTW